MAKIRKAALAYAEMVHSGKLGKLTPAELNSIFFILNDLNSAGVSETISQTVADWFKRYGLTVKQKGVGWQISK